MITILTSRRGRSPLHSSRKKNHSDYFNIYSHMQVCIKGNLYYIYTVHKMKTFFCIMLHIYTATRLDNEH